MQEKCWLFFKNPRMWGCLPMEIRVTPQVLLGNTFWLIIFFVNHVCKICYCKKKKRVKNVKCNSLVTFNCRRGLCNFTIFWSGFTNFGEILWISFFRNCYLVFRRLLNDTAFFVHRAAPCWYFIWDYESFLQKIENLNKWKSVEFVIFPQCLLQ